MQATAPFDVQEEGIRSAGAALVVAGAPKRPREHA
jgi:hypothetical protein